MAPGNKLCGFYSLLRNVMLHVCGSRVDCRERLSPPVLTTMFALSLVSPGWADGLKQRGRFAPRAPGSPLPLWVRSRGTWGKDVIGGVHCVGSGGDAARGLGVVCGKDVVEERGADLLWG